MTYPFLEDVALITRTVAGRDSYGDDTYSAASTVVQGAFAPGGSSELVGGQDRIVTQPTVYLPAGAPVSGVDAVLVRGVTYEVDGSPQRWGANLWTGWQPGLSVVVPLRQVTG